MAKAIALASLGLTRRDQNYPSPGYRGDIVADAPRYNTISFAYEIMCRSIQPKTELKNLPFFNEEPLAYFMLQSAGGNQFRWQPTEHDRASGILAGSMKILVFM